jgi:dTDP-glucose pyrophosphorylase
MEDGDRVREIEVKVPRPRSNWIWGAFAMPGAVFHDLHDLWRARARQDEYFGSLVNAWIAEGGEAVGVRRGERYVDVGTLNGYREALSLLAEPARVG